MFTLALIGRPNVGKSSLFNRLCNNRVSIVDAKPGVTRDRVYGKGDFFGKSFKVIDTGGIDPGSDLPFNEKILLQADIAIQEADTLVLVVDGNEGPTLLDRKIADKLRKKGKPLLVAINKIDNESREVEIHPFYTLGILKMQPISALQGSHIVELLEEVFTGFVWEEQEEEGGAKVAIVGKPNVGKSTLLNFLLQEERSIVSDIPGTTRDPINAELVVEDKRYIFIDTAGIRRKKAEKDVIDKFAYIRTIDTIHQSDICLLLLDSREEITFEEKKIISNISEEEKPCIIILNKWDLVKGVRMEHVKSRLLREAPFLIHFPIIFISANTGRNVDRLLPKIDVVIGEGKKKIPTAELNKFMERCLQRYHPPQIQGKRLRIYYMTQTEDTPPRFILFVNDPNLMTLAYRKYLENQIRKIYGFCGSPLRFELRGK